MSGSPKILCFAGSARSGSLNKRLVGAMAAAINAAGGTATVLDLADYPMPIYDGDDETRDGPPENARKLAGDMASHGGLFIASPEYNASLSPLLKNSLDWVSRIRETGIVGLPTGIEVVKSRVIALGAASPGGTGGMRGLIALRYTLEMGFGALVLPEQVLVARAGTAFTETGAIADSDGSARLAAMAAKLTATVSRLAPVTA
ncbi:MAG: NAD(P)H-dependent oxidoreductase [Hyphomicrobiaceae bacterium]|nr:NAD(P)H-dependent oxidoreductase [Hyphomicrobiaceae bacterium]